MGLIHWAGIFFSLLIIMVDWCQFIYNGEVKRGDEKVSSFILKTERSRTAAIAAKFQQSKREDKQ